MNALFVPIQPPDFIVRFELRDDLPDRKTLYHVEGRGGVWWSRTALFFQDDGTPIPDAFAHLQNHACRYLNATPDELVWHGGTVVDETDR